MKIAIPLITIKGGVGRVVTNQKRELEKLGYKVYIIPRDKVENLKESVERLGADIIFSQDWSCALKSIFKNNHYVCFHGHNPKESLKGTIGYYIQSIIGKLKGRKLFVVGDTLKKRFPKSTVIYNAVDTKEFYDMKKERKYLGWIKRDYEEIDFEEIVDLCNKEDLKLSVVKDVPPEKMNEWYNSLKVFVSKPKAFAGFNLCWLEALAAGVPDVRGNGNGIGITNAHNIWKTLTWEKNAKILDKEFYKLLPYERLKGEEPNAN